MKFVKMHGCGNDYVYLDAVRDERIAGMVERGGPGWADLVRRMSDRHKGIGSDGVIVVGRPTVLRPTWHAGLKPEEWGADVRMRMFNADGSESEMCGNGVRCVAKFAHDRLGVRENPMRVETGRGVLGIEYKVDRGKMVEATVDMGSPILNWSEIPVDSAFLHTTKEFCTTEIEVGGEKHRMFFVSMGNPHAVEFVDDIDRVDLAKLGPMVETHPAFPKRVNYHVAQVLHERGNVASLKMRTWERGSGETMACGTGACAVGVAAYRTFGNERIRGRLQSPVIQLPGGSLRISIRDGEHAGTVLRVSMTGPAEDICEGEWLGDGVNAAGQGGAA